jgi:hypothetical protein
MNLAIAEGRAVRLSTSVKNGFAIFGLEYFSTVAQIVGSVPADVVGVHSRKHYPVLSEPIARLCARRVSGDESSR